MSKRKTRQQKVIADLKKKALVAQEQTSVTAHTSMPQTLPAQHKPSYMYTSSPTIVQTKSLNMTSTTAIYHDLMRSILVTGGVLFAQIFLYILVISHKIYLPGVNY